jgi:transposase
LLALERSLWTFAYREGVEPTNNAAERALRHAVL